MSSSTRRRQAEINSWLEEQKHTDRSTGSVARPDPGDGTYYLVEKLSNLLDRGTHSECLDSSSHQSKPSVNTVIRDAQERMGSMSTRKPSYNAAILSPVHSASEIGMLPPSSQYISHITNTSMSSLFREFPGQRRGSYDFGRSAAHARHDQPFCFTPEYHRDVPSRELSGLCQLCGTGSSPIGLFLKKANPNLQTEGFPPPHTRAKYAYPLATGHVPEIDIISTFICCDPCSFFVKKIGRAPFGAENLRRASHHQLDPKPRSFPGSSRLCPRTPF